MGNCGIDLQLYHIDPLKLALWPINSPVNWKQQFEDQSLENKNVNLRTLRLYNHRAIKIQPHIYTPMPL
jgi:hypothetical protein